LVLGAVEARITAADDEALVCLEPADFEEPELGAIRTDVGDVIRDGAGRDLLLDSG
jgi:hypothetical protein